MTVGVRVALAVLLLVLSSCSLVVTGPEYPPPAPDEVLERAFTPAELAADVDELFAILEEVHPDPYAVLARDEVAARRAALVAGLDRPLTRREFQPRLAELVAALGDGHTSVHLPQEEWWKGPAQACFPLDVAWDGQALRVRRSVPAGGSVLPAPGTRVVSISGRAADELVRRFVAQRSGEAQAFRVDAVERAFPLHLWLEGVEPPYRLVCEPDGAAAFEVDVPGLGWNAVERGAAPGVAARWALEHPAAGVALLTVDTLAAEEAAFADFLAQVFRGLRERPPRALVVDLRRNGGGDSRLGDELLQYVAHAPWRQAARKDWRMSDRYRDWFLTFVTPWLRWLPLQYVHPMGWRMWTADAGEIVSFDEELVEPRDEPLRFDGPVAFLIGPGTFSSAMTLAAAVKDYGLALLVGEPTGGQANAFGEVMPFQLPRTRLGGQVSSARFVRPNGDASTTGGVEPDLFVRPAPGAPGDAVLEAAVSRLLSPVARP